MGALAVSISEESSSLSASISAFFRRSSSFRRKSSRDCIRDASWSDTIADRFLIVSRSSWLIGGRGLVSMTQKVPSLRSPIASGAPA